MPPQIVNDASQRSTIDIVRLGLLVILVVGLGGTIVELLLLKHTDGFWQLVPLALLVLALAVVGWCLLAQNRRALRTFQALMLLFLVSGLIGAVQHFKGNIAYEKESNPSLSGIDLYKHAVTGSTPTLAPGTMIQLGLVGLLFAFRHPSLTRGKRDEDQP